MNARRAKDFKQSDAIRDALLADGWIIEDTPQGARVKRALAILALEKGQQKYAGRIRVST